MTEGKKVKRLSKVVRELNVGISTIVDFLNKNGIEVASNPNSKIDEYAFDLLSKEFSKDIKIKEESEKIDLDIRRKKESISVEEDVEEKIVVKEQDVKQDPIVKTTTEKPKSKPTEEKTQEKIIKATEDKRVGIKIVGKIDPNTLNKQAKVSTQKDNVEKKTTETKKEFQKQAKVEKTINKKTSEKPKTTAKPAKKEVQKVTVPKEIKTEVEQLEDVKVVGKIDLETLNQKTRPDKKTREEKEKERRERKKTTSKQDGKKRKKVTADDDNEFFRSKENKKTDTVGKIKLSTRKKEQTSDDDEDGNSKKRRKRIQKDRINLSHSGDKDNRRQKSRSSKYQQKKEISEEDVQKQIKDTLARLTSGKTKGKGAKYRREKREAVSQKAIEEIERIEQEKNIIKVTEFVSVAELASMMDIQVNEIISTCMSLGLFVSINQRLDAETMALLADEFGYKVEFVSADLLEAINEEEDNEEDLIPRSPIVTVMGHVDHGKTSLLDYIRNANVTEAEAGGITQHIGAYGVKLSNGKKITFLDTPGHEAFTAMRARGAQVTDIVIIIVAADDNVMPQTVEAINHAQAAGVPIVFAINKIDRPNANPEKIKEALANMNLLVEEWGGKYQSQDISAKKGQNIEELLEKVMLEAELLDLKANPNKKAVGTVIEASLDKGRGYVTNMLVQAGTLKIGDILLAGNYTGRIKAMYNEHNEAIEKAGPSQAVLILGLNGAPQAGDKFNVMDSDKEAKDIANRRLQLAREQGMRTQKHITLDEIGRRIAIGNFQELNIIVKGDVDGSVEALSDSLIKLSTDEIQVKVIRKAVGQISETDIILAAASDAIIIGFQVRPSLAARKQAEKEEIDIRLYSVIYDAINEVKDAMEGMLSPDIKEEITATVEVREIFKITKVGTIAGCFVRDGKIKRSDKVRVIREGIVVYTGELGSLKRFKDDVREVASGYECGLNIEKYNDIKVNDIVEAYNEVEIKRSL